MVNESRQADDDMHKEVCRMPSDEAIKKIEKRVAHLISCLSREIAEETAEGIAERDYAPFFE